MNVGGAERLTFNLCKYFSLNSDHVSVFSSGGIFADKLRDLKVNTIKSDFSEGKNFAAIRNELKTLLAAHQFDIIHVQHRIFLPILKTLNTGNAKTIYTAHNFFNDLYQKIIFPDAAVAISPAIEKNLLKTTLLKKDHIFRVNNGVEILETPVRKTGPVLTLGFVGRLIKEKGIHQLLNAVKGINSDKIKLIIFGEGPEKENITKYIDAERLDSRIEIMPPTLNMDDIYRHLDVLLLPTSLNEGLPLTILEALARKIIVISTSRGAICDVITDKETGLLLKDNSVESIAGGINYLIKNQQMWKKMREHGYEKVKNEYSQEAMLEGYGNLYSTL